MVIFINTTQDQEMTFVNPVPQEDGVTGRQLNSALNGLNISLRNAESLPAFKHGLPKVLFDS